MKKILLDILGRRSILLYTILILILCCLAYLATGIALLEDITFGLFVFAAIVALSQIPYSLYKKEWSVAFWQFTTFSFIIIFFIIYAIASFFVSQMRPDTFADNLTIPEGITINIPTDSLSNTADGIKTELDFEICNYFQPGIFRYSVWIKDLEDGVIFLKAFEVTQEFPLSPENLRKRSTISVINSTSDITRLDLPDHFTIYEGDWGKPYAARFELWFKPKSGDKERKLLEKIYKIEGWQR